MSVPAPRKRKRTSFEETARVLRVYDVLIEELDRRQPAIPLVIYDFDKGAFTESPLRAAALAAANSIASRTED